MVSLSRLGLCAAGILGLSAGAVQAVSFTGAAYTQNFDAYYGDATVGGGTTPGLAWTNNVTIPGWYAYQSGGTVYGAGAPATITRAEVSQANRSTNLWRPTSGTDMAFGASNTGSNSGVITGYISYGFALTNDTTETMTSFTLSYNVEKWWTNLLSGESNGTWTTHDPGLLSWSVGATGVSNAEGFGGVWNSAPSLGYDATFPTNATLTGWSVSPTSQLGTVTDINWAPGQTLFIRWQDFNINKQSDLSVTAADRGVGIDDVVFTAAPVPEPTSLALIGMGAVGLLGRRRRAM